MAQQNDPGLNFHYQDPNKKDPFSTDQRAGSLLSNLGKHLGAGIGNALGPNLDMGFDSLAQIIGARGKTDGAAFNRMLAGLGRDNQGANHALQGSLARSGLQGSGIGQALGVAVDSAGRNRVAGVKAQETALTEQRKRDDLNLLMSMLFDPAIALSGQGMQSEMMRKQMKSQEKAAMIGAVGDIVGGLMPVCWVARAAYGPSNPRWLVARHYMLNDAPAWLLHAYVRFGPTVGKIVEQSKTLQRFGRALFDRAIKRYGV